jgi:ubiquinone/menaquinone biosynthesis C-methylase UbiE
MERTENLKHWEQWASDYGAELRATTKCVSIKRLEVEALVRHIEVEKALVLEVGCGNGANGFALASRAPGLEYIGLDFAPAMIANAVKSLEKSPTVRDRMAFGVADGRQLARPVGIDAAQPHHIGAALKSKLPAAKVDIVFTDRMLINLSSHEEQLAIMHRIAEVLTPGGLFLMIENSVQTHGALNEVRKALGLPPRPPASYNVFIDEPKVIEPFKKTMTLQAIDDFGSLHDLLLYAVDPAATDGEVHYDSKLMTRLTDASLALSELGLGANGFGQNRLWVWKK